MQFFRNLVIGTLHFVAFLAFIAWIVVAAWTGYETGVSQAAEAVAEAGANASFITEIPAWGWAIIYGIVGYLSASIATGILFVLLDIQDGIRDLNRLLGGKKESAAPAPKA